MNNLYVIDKDFCPEYDTVIMQGLCNGCRYYKEFEKKDGQRCISCAYHSETHNEEK